SRWPQEISADHQRVDHFTVFAGTCCRDPRNQGHQEPTVWMSSDRPLTGKFRGVRTVAERTRCGRRAERRFVVGRTRFLDHERPPRARATNATWAGRAASLRLREPYPCSPYGT